MENILSLKEISYKYPSNDKETLSKLDFDLRKDEKIGLIASNGSGKTTMFRIIMGLIKPDSGKVEVFGKEVSNEKDFLEVRKRIGLLFQDADDQLFSPTVIEDVAFGPLNQGLSKKEALKKAEETLSFLGIESFRDRITFKLSGGEKRLVSLATVLAMGPEVILLDEPTTGLDEETKDKLIEVLKSLSLTSVIISHDAEFINSVTDKIYTIRNGKVLTDKDIYIHSHVHEHTIGKEHHGHPHGREVI